MFNAEKVEADIEAYVKGILSGTKVDLIIRSDEQPAEVEDTVKKQLDKIETELKRAKNAYMNGVFDLEEYREIRSELEKRKKILSAESSKVSSKVQSMDQYELLVKKIKSAWDLYEKVGTAEEKRTILSTFIKEINISRDRWEVVFYI